MQVPVADRPMSPAFQTVHRKQQRDQEHGCGAVSGEEEDHDGKHGSDVGAGALGVDRGP
jgi:hypothetical protein